MRMSLCPMIMYGTWLLNFQCKKSFSILKKIILGHLIKKVILGHNNDSLVKFNNCH